MTRPFRRIALALLAVAAALAAGLPAFAGGMPVLRPHVTVEDGLVTLGDLFENAGAAADIAVFRAPDPGEVGTVSAQRIAETARRHGLEWSNRALVASVTVARASTPVSLAAIKEAIGEMARRRLRAGATVEVTLDSQARPLHFASRAGAAIDVVRFDLNPDSGDFTAEIRPVDLAAGPVRAVYRGRVVETVRMPVPRGPLTRGSEIRPSDIAVTDMPRRSVPHDAVTDIEAIVGMAARRSLIAGEPVREGDIEAPKIVQRNGSVMLVYRTDTLTITTLGRSLDDGAEGDSIRVLNLRSKRIIDAVVTGRNKAVVINPLAMRTALLAGPAGAAE